MMKLVTFVVITILLILFIFFLKKSLHILDNIFIILFLEYFFTNYYAILSTNTNVWGLSNTKELLIIFRLLEVFVMPLMILGYLNIVTLMSDFKKRLLFSIFYVVILYSIEYLLVQWKVIIYNDWSIWKSILVITILLFVSTLLHKGFNRITKREEILEDNAPSKII